ncbi:MAG: Asp-tRNA(Asn)/Glu-tRNA(Gln) amidotransferase subunit GatC [Deltaproteobacteria bacterium]|nr:Asp-tRNA(Asn)/Glu-tRNA(Gln) amidotransferase subunit GatC [Deltaproteobacteria bacterium]
MKITRDEVIHVAALARLCVAGDDIDRMADQVGDILSYVETLSRVDTTGVPPTAHAIDINNAFRDDTPGRHLDNAGALANAPEAEDGLFVVPRII